MIPPEQLAQALDRIPPQDRELLSLSLRRRVPDEALAQLFEIDAAELARRRARAIERLADEMELQRGEELGSVLQALLDPETWSVASAAAGEEFAASAGGGGPSRVAAIPLPSEPVQPPAPALIPVPAIDESDREPPSAEATAAQPAAPENVAPERPRRSVLAALLGMAAVALAGAAGVIGATQFGDDPSNQVVERSGGGDDGTRRFVPQEGGPMAAPFPSDPQTASCYSTARVRRPTVLYRRPGARKRIKIKARTEWNTPRVLGVIERRSGWLAVQAPELRNGELAWLRRSEVDVDCSRWSLHADLSKRRLLVRRDGRTVRRLAVAIGRSANPTPRGRFSITDKLKVSNPANSPYGCCVLALTGHQTDLPPNWPGGDRLAVHATNDGSSIGQPVSLGCLRARSNQVRWLIETIPVGAPIFIRA